MPFSRAYSEGMEGPASPRAKVSRALRFSSRLLQQQCPTTEAPHALPQGRFTDLPRFGRDGHAIMNFINPRDGEGREATYVSVARAAV